MFISAKKHTAIKRSLEASIVTLTNKVGELERSVEPLRSAKDSAIRDLEKMQGKIERLELALGQKDIETEKVKKMFSGQYNIFKDIEKPVRELMAIVNVFREQKDDKSNG